MKIERGTIRNDMRLKAENSDLEFYVFMRINEKFPENFSIGLVVRPKDEPGDICLLRCNGPHGEFTDNPLEPIELHPHFCTHIHKAREQNMRDGLLPERHAEKTESYASYEEALSFFVKETNIINAERHLSIHPQLGLFNNSENQQ